MVENRPSSSDISIKVITALSYMSLYVNLLVTLLLDCSSLPDMSGVDTAKPPSQVQLNGGLIELPCI